MNEYGLFGQSSLFLSTFCSFSKGERERERQRERERERDLKNRNGVVEHKRCLLTAGM